MQFKEHETPLGRSDLELITNRTHLIFEFKRTYPGRGPEASLAAAISQLKQKRYGSIATEERVLYRLAMVISTEEKMILPGYCREVD